MTENRSAAPDQLKDYGFLAYIVERFFRLLQFIPPWCILSNRPDHQQTYDPDDTVDVKEKVRTRATKIDIYVCLWLIVECLLIAAAYNWCPNIPGYGTWTIRFFAILRIVNIVEVSVNMAIFDHLRLKMRGHEMASYVRTFVLTTVNYMELFICFGLVYVTMLGRLYGADDWTDALYFSVVSQLTIGYGDITPIKEARVFVAIQGVIGLFFALLVLARLITILPKPKSVMGDDT